MAESKKLNSANNYIAIVVLVSFLVLLASVLIGKALVGQLLLNNRVIVKKTKALDQLKSNADSITALQLNYAALGGRAQTIDDALPNKPDFPAIVAMVEVMANTSGVRLKSIAPEGNVVALSTATKAVGIGASPKSYTFSVVAEGSYDSLLKFYATIEQSARPLRVSSITQTGNTQLQAAELAITTYYQDVADLAPKTEIVK